MDHSVILVLASIGLLSLVSQWLAWRSNVPAILYLLAAGILIGPVTGWLQPDELFGDLLFPFISLSVAVILFEGSLTLQWHEIREHGSVVRNMVSVGFLVPWLIVALTTHWFVGLAWPLAFLFGAIMVVTGPTVIMPMLRAVRPNSRIANILRWEGILIDPVGAILAVLTFNIIIASQFTSALDEALVVLATMLGAGVLIGGLAGYLWGYALRAHWIPDFLQNVATLLIVFAVYALADFVERESGLLAVTVMGIWLANMKRVHVDEILDFKESLSLLLISGLFILLAARLNFEQLLIVGWPALAALIAIQFVARPLKVVLCSLGSSLSWREQLALGWIGPRGIVAAAISAVFAIRLEAEGFQQAALLVPLAFVVIVGTVALQSMTAGPLVRALGVAAPPPEGALIVGANPVGCAVGQALHDQGFRVLVADTVWDGIRRARMAGLETYFGSPLSDHAERTMDLSGIGKLLAMSRRPDFNSLVCAHFAGEFGRRHVYTLPSSIEANAELPDKYRLGENLPGRPLFGSTVSLAKMASLISQGATIKMTGLTEDFDYAAYREQYEGRCIPLFAWNSDGRLMVMTPDDDWQPEQGWTVASLVQAEGADAQAGEGANAGR